MLCMDMIVFHSWDYYNCVELEIFIEEIVVSFNNRSEDGTLHWFFF